MRVSIGSRPTGGSGLPLAGGVGSRLAGDAAPGVAATTATPRRVLVLGGTSEIAAAIVRELAAQGPCEVALAGRDAEGLSDAAQRLRVDGCARVETLALEACEPDGHRAVLARGTELLGGVDLVILAVGVLGAERGGLPEDLGGAVEVLEVNVVGAGSLLLESARALRERGSGTIVVLSSVAAERPRATNAVYCASKAGLDALAQGLADALAPTGVRVMVVRPGFVKTRMTRGLPVPPLATDPETVARATVRGLRRGAQTVWAPAVLRWVMVLVRLLPRPLFRRLPL
jgi:decaprenylphospho-beta-D-erythro-pentofuranosid-2-ulose 2-reductase